MRRAAPRRAWVMLTALALAADQLTSILEVEHVTLWAWPAGEGEAEIQKMLFVGNYSDAVEACLEVSTAGAGLLSCPRARKFCCACLQSRLGLCRRTRALVDPGF